MRQRGSFGASNCTTQWRHDNSDFARDARGRFTLRENGRARGATAYRYLDAYCTFDSSRAAYLSGPPETKPSFARGESV